MYYIWEQDELTAELTEILLERMRAGVEVRMLNDLFGCLAYKKDEIKRLRAAGARVLFDVTDVRKLNYRNHRKIVVIDSVLGYTGGINVGQEYIDGKPNYASWRDTHCKFHGPAVADLQKLFAIRWLDRTDEDLYDERFFPLDYPEHGRCTLAQTVSQGVEIEWDPGRRAHEVGIASAEDRIWIQSPYFIPTPAIYQIMINQALAGRDVRLMVTGVPDKVLAWRAAETFFRPLLEAGAKVYRYDAGFFHAKTMTIDGEAVVIGTMNMDIRSLALHKELMVWFYDQDLTAQHEAIFVEDMTRCSEVTLEIIDGWSRAHHLRNALSRLMSNLM
jgi:cardiolipin synthase